MKAHATVQQKHQQENLRSVVSLTEPARQQPLDLMALQTAIGNQAMQSALLRSVATVQRKTVGTGLPYRLRTGIEGFSGIAMGDVTVHYNSSKPANVEALAYTQGNEIHLGPGQEKHLPHEAWHVVQQKQGRVSPTMQLGAVGINDDQGLEREADVMSEQAMLKVPESHQVIPAVSAGLARPAVQRTVDLNSVTSSVQTEDTIWGALNKVNLKNYYILPENIGLPKSKDSLDRPDSIEAIITALPPNARGKASTEYGYVSAMGNWEQLASSHVFVKKNIDVGHLIADNFFDDNKSPQDQKWRAYEIDNLAPQVADFNEHAYRKQVEIPIEKNFNLKNLPHGTVPAPVKLKVDLTYGRDLPFSLDDLVERGALNPKPPLPLGAATSISVPSRMPKTWQATVTPQPLPLPTRPVGKKRPLPPGPPKLAWLPTPIGSAGLDPRREEFSHKVPFAYRSEAVSATGIDYTFAQSPLYPDPEAKRNPVRMAADPESGRFTTKQKERAKQTLSDAKRFKILRRTMDHANATGAAPNDSFKAQLVDLLTTTLGSNTTVAAALIQVDNLLIAHKYPQITQGDVLSEDEDISSAMA